MVEITSAHLRCDYFSVRIFSQQLEKTYRVDAVDWLLFTQHGTVDLCIYSTLHFLFCLDISKLEGLWPIPTADNSQKMRDNDNLGDKRCTCRLEGAETVKPPLTHCTRTWKRKWKWKWTCKCRGVTCAPKRQCYDVQQKATISKGCLLECLAGKTCEEEN